MMVITVAAYVMMATFHVHYHERKNVTIHSFGINSISFRNYFGCYRSSQDVNIGTLIRQRGYSEITQKIN